MKGVGGRAEGASLHHATAMTNYSRPHLSSDRRSVIDFDLARRRRNTLPPPTAFLFPVSCSLREKGLVKDRRRRAGVAGPVKGQSASLPARGAGLCSSLKASTVSCSLVRPKHIPPRAADYSCVARQDLSPGSSGGSAFALVCMWMHRYVSACGEQGGSGGVARRWNLRIGRSLLRSHRRPAAPFRVELDALILPAAAAYHPCCPSHGANVRYRSTQRLLRSAKRSGAV